MTNSREEIYSCSSNLACYKNCNTRKFKIVATYDSGDLVYAFREAIDDNCKLLGKKE